MTRFEGSITSMEVAIKDMREYVGKVTSPHPLHEMEKDLYAFAMRIALGGLVEAISQGGTGHVGPVHVDAQGQERRLLEDARPLTYRSLFGPLEISRAYYYLDFRTLNV